MTLTTGHSISTSARPRHLKARIAGFALVAAAGLLSATEPASALKMLSTDPIAAGSCHLQNGIYAVNGEYITYVTIYGKVGIRTRKQCQNGTMVTVSSQTFVV